MLSSKNKDARIKLADFGLSVEVSDDKTYWFGKYNVRFRAAFYWRVQYCNTMQIVSYCS